MYATILDLANGISSHYTFGLVFATLDQGSFSDGFHSSVPSIAQSDVVAIDSRAMRRTLDRANDAATIHLVSEFTAAKRLLFGQVKLDNKSNEIAAVLASLQRLTLQGCLVIIDAKMAQKKTRTNCSR